MQKSILLCSVLFGFIRYDRYEQIEKSAQKQRKTLENSELCIVHYALCIRHKENTMPSYRLGRINDDIKKEIAAMIPNLKDPRVHGMISVTRVDTTSDLRYCKVYVSALDKSDMKEVIRGLKSASGFMRRELGQRVKLRYTPELTFIADDSMDEGARILKLMNELK